jgi:exopolysaccharide production protein ExoY
MPSDPEPNLYARFGKRGLDLVLAALLLAILAPVFVAIWVVTRLTSRGPGIFVQERIGKGGVPFRFYKFRSMYVSREPKVQVHAERLARQGILYKPTNDPRITPLGRFLRRTSLDELPQLFNVLKGDMSLVGPRPLVPFMYHGRDDEKRLRASVLPGLTGLWQIRARAHNQSLEAMVAHDREYLETISFRTDLSVLARTVRVVVKGDGAV